MEGHRGPSLRRCYRLRPLLVLFGFCLQGWLQSPPLPEDYHRTNLENLFGRRGPPPPGAPASQQAFLSHTFAHLVNVQDTASHRNQRFFRGLTHGPLPLGGGHGSGRVCPLGGGVLFFSFLVQELTRKSRNHPGAGVPRGWMGGPHFPSSRDMLLIVTHSMSTAQFWNSLFSGKAKFLNFDLHWHCLILFVRCVTLSVFSLEV